MEKIIDVTVARRQLGTLLDEVFHKGDVFTIKRKGKALARIVPLDTALHHKEKESLSLKQKELLKELNSLPVIGMDKDPVEVLRSIRQQKRIEAGNKDDK
ncbi:type II toxin-antitoxin system Phd/YefM family antitoxin [Desulfobacter vibrioformis]|uniref:type II toxin-antitoxin system Phd/YefM family antitoxin n=1 Tax=Desulfobacter vibrioformis TaxID=34031 RepID=UPI0005591561|nr:type II toxin-antitoxin system Phd/YefM family antitoxin [Desulfobacter vibrioformis]